MFCSEPFARKIWKILPCLQLTTNSGADIAGHRNVRSRYACGFSLIELLITIAIVAILSTLLLGGLNRARQQGQKIVCVSNLRQQYLAWQFYPADNDDKLVPNQNNNGIRIPFDGFSFVAPSWVQGSMADSFPNEQTNHLGLVDPRFARFAPYIGQPHVYKCPADRSKAVAPLSAHPRVRSYSMNEHMGGNNGRFGLDGPEFVVFETLNPYNATPRPMFRKLDHLLLMGPGNYWLTVDEHADTIGAPAFRVVFDNERARTYGMWARLPALRHGKATPFIFADGHSVLKTWQDPRTRKEVEGKTILGIVTSKNPDSDWLQEHTAPTAGFLMNFISKP